MLFLLFAEIIIADVDLSSLLGTSEPDRWTFEGGRIRLSEKHLEGYPRSPKRYRRSTTVVPDPRRARWFKPSTGAAQATEAGPSQPAFSEEGSAGAEGEAEEPQAGPSHPVVPEEGSLEAERGADAASASPSNGSDAQASPQAAALAPEGQGSGDGGQAGPQGAAPALEGQGSRDRASHSRFPAISAGVLEGLQGQRGNLQVDEVDAPLRDVSIGVAFSATALIEALAGEGRQGSRQGSNPSSSPHSVKGSRLFVPTVLGDSSGMLTGCLGLAGAQAGPTEAHAEVVSPRHAAAGAGMPCFSVALLI